MAQKIKKFEVTPEDENARLDLFLVRCLGKDLSRSRIQKLIENGLVLLDQKQAKPHTKLKSGQLVNVEFQPRAKPSVEPENIPINIAYEDNDLIVVNKPSGVVVHPAPGNQKGTLVNALLYHTKLSSFGAPLRPGVVHRLDKEVSGLLVFAKNDFAYLDLIKQFKERIVNRKYIALVKGSMELDEGEIVLPLGRHPRVRQRIAVRFIKSKEAKTRYKVLKRFKDYTLVELTLGTGRTHQIRVHLSYMGHPILGDGKYGPVPSVTGRAAYSRIMLHAKILGFRHPRSKKYVEFQSEIPPEMAHNFL